jgi:alpha-L-rhamnosidase
MSGYPTRIVALYFMLLCGVQAAYWVVNLRCELTSEPLGVDAPTPRLSWQIASDEPDQRQTAWQVLVSTSPADLDQASGDAWDSGRVEGDQTVLVSYKGRPPASSERLFWKVRSWDRAGRPSDWSETASWTMGLLAPGDWHGRWITANSADRLENTLLRRDFAVRPGLKRALAHVTGLGQYELFINGEKAGTDVLSPGWTDYKDTILYDTRDVTGLLREGANSLGLALGNGMAHVVRPEGRFAKFKGSYGPQRAILHLRLEYLDGAIETIGTNDTWKTHAGPITFSSIYGGEDFDARLAQSGWHQPGFDDTGWTPAALFTGESGILRGQSHAAEAVAPIETRTVVGIRELSPGVVLYDFGQNASFMPRLAVTGPAGSTIKLTGGEVVNADGTINRSTMGGAHRGSAWWQYTKHSDGPETWFPQFYYIGSRYLYAELLPAAEGGARPAITSLEMVVVHSLAKPAGGFVCSDPTLNRIRDLVRWAQRSNMVSILTDCPHREKLGWLEQNHLNGPALRYEWAIDRLAVKNARDMAEAQTPEGLIPNIAPEYTVFKGTYRAAAEWGASFILVPWQQYVFSGDIGPLREHYEAMKRYFAYLESRAGGGLLAEGLGDWYDVVVEKPGRANLTPPTVTATAHLWLDAHTLAKIAATLGYTGDAEMFTAKADSIRNVYNRELYDSATPALYGSGSQTSLAIPLALGLVDQEARSVVLNALLKDIELHGHATTGAIGTPYLFRALTDAGHADLVYRLITNPDKPGYAYQLKQGNTALAESWTAQTGASQNHFFLGSVVEWFYRDVAGIVPDESAPGFKHLIIRPHPVPGLTWVEAWHDTPHGRVMVRWERNDGKLVLNLHLPANTGASVEMPTKDGSRLCREVASGRHVFESDG